MSTLSDTILQKVLKLVLLTATGTEVSIDTMITFLSDSFDSLEETHNQMKSLNIKSDPGENVTDSALYSW